MDINDAFAVLNLSPQASPEQIRSAYRELVRRWHPDQYAKQADLRRHAEETLKEINLAYGLVKGHLRVDRRPPRHPSQTYKKKENQIVTGSFWRFFLKALGQFISRQSFHKPQEAAFRRVTQPPRTDRIAARAASFQQVFDDMFETGRCKKFCSTRKRSRIRVQRFGPGQGRKRPGRGPISPIRPVTRIGGVTRIS
jgi:curved DNA-binding protein CbpA